MGSWATLTNSAVAMMAQSHALGQISTNVTNMNTNGYKEVDTQFKTLLTETSPQFDFFSVRAMDYRRVDQQGTIAQTGRGLDIAVGGSGLFTVNTAFDGSGETLYTRDGGFEARVVGDDAFLTTSRGHFLQGWAINEDGTFPQVDPATGSVEGAPLVPLQINTFDTIPGEPTTNVSVNANIDSNAFLAPQTFGVTVYDSPAGGETANTAHNVLLSFSRVTTETSTWTLSMSLPNGGTATLDTSTLEFDGSGQLVQPASETVTATFDFPNGTQTQVPFDLSGLTQFAGETRIDQISADGRQDGLLTGTYFNEEGILFAEYSNSVAEPIYQLAMSDFIANDNLEAISGNLFRTTAEAGDRRLFSVSNVLEGGTRLTPGALELSNVDLADQFTQLMTTQTAYSSAANVFKTSDEMIQTAAELKR